MAAKKTSPAQADQTVAPETAKSSAKKAPARTPAKKATAAKASAAKRTSAVKLAVRPGEKPWTPKQVTDVRATLQADAERLEVEIASAEEEISQLLRQGGEGAGHDQADV
ncbi:MAG: hypothetical protein H0U51_05975, partial [Propionibacteriales bacterium]|nr:hypothetical protein [Propionibacteriales bacterium]